MNPQSKNEYCELPAAVAPPWIELPGDVTANILQRLDYVDILQSAEKVCTTWRRVCSDPAMWRALHIEDADLCDERTLNLWRLAVDRSQGQLLHLTMQDFEDDDNVLNYIVDRSTALKRLTLEECIGITGGAVVEVVNKLPHLEELHLIGSPIIKASDIVKIGKACPLLKSFTFSQSLYVLDPRFIFQLSHRNKCALAIAKSMPNLCHLCLISNLITNEGLEAILDGCPKLESLDLQECYDLDLRGALGQRCSEQIKHLKIPHYSLKRRLMLNEIHGLIADLGLVGSDDDGYD